MLNHDGYSLSDIAAVSNDGFGNGNSWWILILFLLFFSWGGVGGYGFAHNNTTTASGITDGYILTSDFANIERKIDGVNNGLCDGFYAMNTGMLNGFAGVNTALNQHANALGAQITALGAQEAACCCENRNQMTQGFAELNYNLATQNCQTRQAINEAANSINAKQDANTRQILDFLTQDKIASLTAENQSLKFAASQQAQNAYLIGAINPAPVPAYQVPNPYTGGYYRACGNCCA